MDDSIILISSDESSRPQSPLDEKILKSNVKSDIESDDTVDYLPPVLFDVDAKVRKQFQRNDQYFDVDAKVSKELKSNGQYFDVDVEVSEEFKSNGQYFDVDAKVSKELKSNGQYFDVDAKVSEELKSNGQYFDVDAEVREEFQRNDQYFDVDAKVSEELKSNGRYFDVDTEVREEFKSNDQNVVTESQTFSGRQTFLKHKFHSLSDSEESDCEMVVIVEEKQNEEGRERKNSSQQSSDDVNEERNKRPRKKKGMNADTKEEKARKKAEALELRTKRRAEQAKEKAAKKLAAEAHRSKKPGECMKYMQVHLDSRLLSAEFGGELLNGLQAAEVQYVIKDQEVPFSITWTRKTLEPHVGDDLKVEMVSRHEEETEAVLVCLCLEALELVHNNKLVHHVKTAHQKLQKKNLTLVIYGAEQYFRFQKTSKRKEVRNQVLGSTEASSKSNKTDRRFASAPKVSKENWERALAQLQLFAECNHRLIDQPQAMGLFVRQFTKAVAERPFKLEKQRREQEQLQWYAAGDSRDCVRVDKDGNGIHRLWQQQLCQFSRLGMEISEAIVSVYKTPRQLIEAYENCLSQDEGEQLLASIPVRRGVGPLTTVRRVGPDLSRKLYTFFTAIDGDTLLSHE